MTTDKRKKEDLKLPDKIEASQDFDRGYDGIINPSQNSVSFYSIMNSDNDE